MTYNINPIIKFRADETTYIALPLFFRLTMKPNGLDWNSVVYRTSWVSALARGTWAGRGTSYRWEDGSFNLRGNSCQKQKKKKYQHIQVHSVQKRRVGNVLVKDMWRNKYKYNLHHYSLSVYNKSHIFVSQIYHGTFKPTEMPRITLIQKKQQQWCNLLYLKIILIMYVGEESE